VHDDKHFPFMLQNDCHANANSRITVFPGHSSVSAPVGLSNNIIG
jgi:hypothetical protein